MPVEISNLAPMTDIFSYTQKFLELVLECENLVCIDTSRMKIALVILELRPINTLMSGLI